MSPRTGRPPKGDASRKHSLNIRLTDDEAKLIQECADTLKITRTDVIVQGVKLVKAELEKK